MKSTIAVLAASALLGTADAVKTHDPAPDGGALAAKYPKAMPYENDKVVPAIPPGGDNDLDPVVGTTVGGYAAKEFLYCNPYAYWPYGRFTGGPSDCAWAEAHFAMVHIKSHVSVLSAFNCTKANVVFSAGDEAVKGSFTGSPQACDAAACCEPYWGTIYHAADYKNLIDRWNDRYSKYNCQWLTEEAYCQLVFFEVIWCTEQFYSEQPHGMDAAVGRRYAGPDGQRSVIVPCTNLAYYFLYQCKTFKAIGAKGLVEPTGIEPKNYIEEITAEEANHVMAIFYADDRVCDPLSKFLPEERLEAAAPAPAPEPAPAPADGTPAPAPSPTAAPAPAPAPSDSAAASFQPLMVFSGIAAVFGIVRAL